MADAAGTYLIEADVEAELSVVIGDTSQPTSTELNGFITGIESDVKGVLNSVGVSVASIDSTTTPIIYNIVKQWSLWGVCSRTLAAMSGAVTTHLDKEEWYWDRFERRRAEIIANPLVLGGDTPFSTDDDDTHLGGINDDDDDSHDRIFAIDDNY